MKTAAIADLNMDGPSLRVPVWLGKTLFSEKNKKDAVNKRRENNNDAYDWKAWSKKYVRNFFGRSTMAGRPCQNQSRRQEDSQILPRKSSRAVRKM
ncbi:MAG: hypothetical protein LBO05_05065 [Deltaproteobacteria bacterium]|jgi:hypothetical protein|nr:hypothetical protein [Deltaproteobacteria bacterium]